MTYLPEHYQPIIPSLVVDGARDALAFYERAFDARTVKVFTMPDGSVAHAELLIEGVMVFVLDPLPGLELNSPAALSCSTSSFTLYVPDVDTAFARARDAGATVVTPLADTFTGDRCAVLKCPFGHRWILATRTKTVDDETIQQAIASWSADHT